MTRLRLVQLLLAVWGSWSLAEADWDCPTPCRCNWLTGKKSADCSKANLTAIPDGLDADFQILNLSENTLEKIPDNAFNRVGLANLHKLFLRSCGIRELAKNAFNRLDIVREIDLSSNNIAKLHPGTFQNTPALRYLTLSGNPIQELEDGLFSDLMNLQGVMLKDCQIKRIARGAFVNVPRLRLLLLHDNKLTTMEEGTLDSLTAVDTIGLHGNPWHCDCRIKNLWQTIVSRSLIFVEPPVCETPSKLQGKPWSELHQHDLPCKPQIVTPSENIVLGEASGKNVTMACEVMGSPTPVIQWVHNHGSQSFDRERLHLESGSGEREATHWVNLTVINALPEDSGLYTCMVQGAEALLERNVVLLIESNLPEEDRTVRPPPKVTNQPSTETRLLFLRFLQYVSPSDVDSYCTEALEELKRDKEALVAERARSGLLHDQLKECQQQVSSLTSALIQLQLGIHQPTNTHMEDTVKLLSNELSSCKNHSQSLH